MQDLFLICASYKLMQMKALNIHCANHITLQRKRPTNTQYTTCQSHVLEPIPLTPGPSDSHVPEASKNMLLWGSLLSWQASVFPGHFFFLKRLNTQSHSSDSLLENLFSHLFIFSCIPLAPELTFRWGLEPHLGDSSLGASHPHLWPPPQGHHGTMALGMPCQRLLHWDSWRSFPLILPRQPWLSAVTRGQPLFLVDCIRFLPNVL